MRIPYVITHELSDTTISSFPFINYSKQQLENGLQIIPHTLLFEKGIKAQQIEMDEWNSLPIFFSTGGSFIRFDIFAASFYLLSRYEEYFHPEHDEHHRFAHTASLAFKEGFLNKPLINLWARQLWQGLKYYEESMQHYQLPPTYAIASYDIDMAYCYKHKGLLRNIGGLVTDISKLRFNKVLVRIKTLLGLQQDPFDSFDYLKNIHAQTEVPAIYFFLMAKQRSTYDKNINPNSIAMEMLIRSIATHAAIGIHPSYESMHNSSLLDEEIKLLSNQIEEQVLASRQHYIRMQYPDTMVALYLNGIRAEYSLGYGSINGFRASTGHAHNFYHLIEDKEYDLRLCPFAWMDANSKFEQKQNTHETELELKHYIDICKHANTHLLTVWHNFALGSDSDWLGWQQIHETFLNKIKK